MSRLTPWFPPEVKPVRFGIYERLWSDGPLYALWNGKHWKTSWGTPDVAARNSSIGSGVQNLPWRGLAEKP